MKLYQLFLLAFLAVVPTLKAAVEYDLKKGIDLTATNIINTTILNQLVDVGTVGHTNKGILIRKSSNGLAYWPSITDNPRYTNFLWLDTYTMPGILKQYVPGGDGYTNWVSSTITPSSVTTVEILNGTILEADMANNSVNNNQLVAGSVTPNKLGDLSVVAGKIAAAAVLQGNLADSSVITASISNLMVTTIKIAANAVDRSKLLDGAVGHLQLTNNAVMAYHLSNDAVTASAILTNTITTNKLAGDINRGLLNTNVSYGLVRAWAKVSSAGTILAGFNVGSVTKTSLTGNYTINFNSGYVPANSNYCVNIQPFNATVSVSRFGTVRTNSHTFVSIVTSTSSTVEADSDFSITIVGGDQ